MLVARWRTGYSEQEWKQRDRLAGCCDNQGSAEVTGPGRGRELGVEGRRRGQWGGGVGLRSHSQGGAQQGPLVDGVRAGDAGDGPKVSGPGWKNGSAIY